MKIERIDHLNLTVADIDRSLEFYNSVLGMEVENISERRAALHFGQHGSLGDKPALAHRAGWVRVPPRARRHLDQR